MRYYQLFFATPFHSQSFGYAERMCLLLSKKFKAKNLATNFEKFGCGTVPSDLGAWQNTNSSADSLFKM